MFLIFHLLHDAKTTIQFAHTHSYLKSFDSEEFHFPVDRSIPLVVRRSLLPEFSQHF